MYADIEKQRGHEEAGQPEDLLLMMRLLVKKNFKSRK